MVVRRATLADVAAVARMTVRANREANNEFPAMRDEDELSAPELALRLLRHLDDGNLLYVAERKGGIIGFAQVTGLMVADGGHLVELRHLYVDPEARRQGAGRALLDLVRYEVAQRPNPPALETWVACGSVGAEFLQLAGGTATGTRWKVGPGGIAVRGVIYAWKIGRTNVVRRRALAT